MTRFRSHKAVQEYLANRGRITLLFSGVVVTVSILLFFYVWQFTRMVEIQIGIRDVRKARSRLNLALEAMEVERAKLTAIARIDKLARTQLNMVPPSRENIQYLTENGMVVAPEEGSPKEVSTAATLEADLRRARERQSAAQPPPVDPLNESQIHDAIYRY